MERKCIPNVKARSPVLVAVCSCIVILTLEGCADQKKDDSGGQGPCPVGVKRNPPDVKFDPDYERLDRLAGCNNNWNFFFGKPCSSDVPILLGKKSLYLDSDKKWIRRNLENEETICLTRYQSVHGEEAICSSWFSAQRGCWRDELAICNCSAPRPTTSILSNARCTKWRCFTKEIHHSTCWEANWDSKFETTCGPKGSYPMSIGLPEFEKMLREEVRDAAPSNVVIGSNDFVTAWRAAQNRKSWTFNSPNERECLVNVPVEDKPGMKPVCDHWRLVRSKLLDCSCTGTTCGSWMCDAQRGMYMQYAGMNEALFSETRKYKCLVSLGIRCVHWSSEMVGFPLVGLSQCRSCAYSLCSSAGLESACTMYVMQRVKEFQDSDGEDGLWGERIAFFALHALWIAPIAAMGGLAVGLSAQMFYRRVENSQNRSSSFCLLIGIVPCAMLVWVIAFVRKKRDTEAGDVVMPMWEWQAPLGPLYGVLAMFFIASVPAWFAYYILKKRLDYDNQDVVAVAFVFVSWVLAIGLLYVCGLLVSLITFPGLLFAFVKSYQAFCEEMPEMSSWPTLYDSTRAGLKDSELEEKHIDGGYAITIEPCPPPTPLGQSDVDDARLEDPLDDDMEDEGATVPKVSAEAAAQIAPNEWKSDSPRSSQASDSDNAAAEAVAQTETSASQISASGEAKRGKAKAKGKARSKSKSRASSAKAGASTPKAGAKKGRKSAGGKGGERAAHPSNPPPEPAPAAAAVDVTPEGDELVREESAMVIQGAWRRRKEAEGNMSF